jgi:hypothetical protein
MARGAVDGLEVLIVFPAGTPIAGAPARVQCHRFKSFMRAARCASLAVPVGASRVQIVALERGGLTRRVIFEAWGPGERPDLGALDLPLFAQVPGASDARSPLASVDRGGLPS